MATIRSISGPTEASLTGNARTQEQTVPTPGATQPASQPAEPAKPRGIKEAINQLQDNKVALEKPSLDDLREITKELQETIDRAAPDEYIVGFRQDSRANTYVLEIKDHEGKVKKQFPPEKVLNMHGKLAELSGMVIDELT
jgi:uncharacterized FlaG/YvyC family protein